jgi:hypothetical protein
MATKKLGGVTVGWTHPETEEEFEVECSVEDYSPAVIRMDPDDSCDAEGGEVEIEEVCEENGKARPDIKELIEKDPKEFGKVSKAAFERAMRDHDRYGGRDCYDPEG